MSGHIPGVHEGCGLAHEVGIGNGYLQRIMTRGLFRGSQTPVQCSSPCATRSVPMANERRNAADELSELPPNTTERLEQQKVGRRMMRSKE